METAGPVVEAAETAVEAAGRARLRVVAAGPAVETAGTAV